MKITLKQTFLKLKGPKSATLLSLLIMILPCHADFTVFAAASTTDVMKELTAEFKETGGDSIRFNFAGSGALARQIDAGAPADLFISANIKWMDFLERKQLTRSGTRTVIAKNSLVLIAPSGSQLTFKGFPSNLKGLLAIGEPKSVPAGAYAKQAMETLNQFDSVKNFLIKGKDVRTVLLYVARGEVEAGIVYGTDANYSDKVQVLGTFPSETHPPIIYPAVCLKNSSEQSKAFLEFLQTETAKAVFAKHGFSTTD